MMKRNGKEVEICWLYLDAEHAEYAGIVAKLRQVHEKDGLMLGVNTRHDRTRALVKLLGPMPALTAAQRGCVLRTYTEVDHSNARAMVRTRATELDASAGWQAPEVAPQVQ